MMRQVLKQGLAAYRKQHGIKSGVLKRAKPLNFDLYSGTIQQEPVSEGDLQKVQPQLSAVKKRPAAPVISTGGASSSASVSLGAVQSTAASASEEPSAPPRKRLRRIPTTPDETPVAILSPHLLSYDSAKKTWTASSGNSMKKFYGPQWKGVEKAKEAALRWLGRQ